MRLPRGTIVKLWSRDGEGVGYMGAWLVGAKTLWDVTDIVPGNALKTTAVPKIYTSISRWERIYTFDAVPRGAQNRILASLDRKNAEGGSLARTLRSERIQRDMATAE